ncbi:hypothetical protein H9P43_004610 [Blastocladiella emersonii ATCC 22665]|nr:hypothetical protein H9P43_004610 [Blastocladiella emersonii ATCC 22665]
MQLTTMTTATTETPKKTIVVTGFGPFLHHTTNPSNIAAEHVRATVTPPAGVELVTLTKVEVAYEYVREHIPAVWAAHRPDFVLHVGVGLPGKFRLERYAKNTGYKSHDVRGDYVWTSRADGAEGATPIQNAIVADDAKDVYETRLDLDRMVTVLSGGDKWAVEVSENAGQYLCDFTYTTSSYLSTQFHDEAHQGRVLFLHVPPVGSPYSQDELNAFVAEAVEYLCRDAVASDVAYRA